ncbi:hypothetical protein HP499_09945 [Paenarthrobacter sp. CM16]|uniref:hypothetical protein n=1 Tax=Paenarthrobacter sp. CM16 TaxID=2738447 RepID=UPI001554C931|nr:hypothetical protein [Paenarthrobacter sp. CM16]NQD88126.1 hypothetical protein [Paenarthrobacter sp. CM16]
MTPSRPPPEQTLILQVHAGRHGQHTVCTRQVNVRSGGDPDARLPNAGIPEFLQFKLLDSKTPRARIPANRGSIKRHSFPARNTAARTAVRTTVRTTGRSGPE